MKPIRNILYLLCLLLLLTACGGTAVEETTEPPTEAVTEPTRDPREDMEHVSMVVTETSIQELNAYPKLKSADLSGSTCYTAIIVYAQEHPELEITYSVDLGGSEGTNHATDLILADQNVEYDALMRNLVYLPQLQSLELPRTSMTFEQVEQLRTKYPQILFTYTVEVLGQEVGEETEELNLAGMTVAQLEEAAPKLMQLPNLRFVELMDASGSCSLSKQDVKTLVEMAPGVKFHYVFQLFGQTISTTDQAVHYKNLNLTPDCEGELRAALAIMSGCDAFILERCGLSSEFLASVREDFTNTELVWRVDFGTDNRYSFLTNAETIRAVYNVTDTTCSELKYCRKAKYIDMGHNETLTDVSFIGYMPDLEILILSGCAASDLSGFGNCKKLEFLELANCGKLEDLSPLAGCEGLKNLNICYTKVKSLLPLDGLPLEQLFCKQTRVPADEQKVFKEIHENCVATFYGKEAYAGPGWRYTDYGFTYTEIYKKVREVFNYDAADKIIRASENANK